DEPPGQGEHAGRVVHRQLIRFDECSTVQVGPDAEETGIQPPEQRSRPAASFAARTSLTASSTRSRTAGSEDVRAATASAMATVGATVFDTIRSPPADRNSTARSAGGTSDTAAVAPRSSDTITPRN